MEVIKLENLSKKFDVKVVLENINLSIMENEMVAIKGPSGKGKTTLLNIIGLISEKSSGKVCIYQNENLSINSKKAMILRRHNIGYLFQNYGLVDDESVFWNLNLAFAYKKIDKKTKIQKINTLLKEFGLAGFENNKIFTLSGGEQQRVAIIRLILQESTLILADEPTGSVDEKNKEIIFSYLKKLNNMKKTLVIVTHDDYIAKKCDRIIQL